MIKKRLLSLLNDSVKYIYFNIALQVISLIAQLFIVASICIILTKVIQGTIGTQDYVMSAFFFFGAIVIRMLCDETLARVVFLASSDVKTVLRKTILQKLIDLGPSYREKVATSEVVQLCSEGVEQLEIYFGRYISQLFYSLIAPLILFGVFTYFVNIKVAAVLLVLVPLIPLSIVLIMKIAKKLLQNYWGIYAGLGDNFLENLQGLTTTKIYMADGFKAKQMDEEADHFRRITMKVLTMQLNSTTVMDIMAYGGAAVGMILAIRDYLAGSLSIVQVLMVILLAAEFFLPLRILGSYFHIAMNGMAASDKIFKLLDLPIPKRGEYSFAGTDSDSASHHVQKDLDIVFEHVNFSYDEDTEILRDISFHLQPKGFISIVGESGSGKSTIAGILTGRNTGYTGSIRIGGVELSEIDRVSLLEEVVLVRSNSYIFKGTIEENLRFAAPHATQAELLDVIEKVNLRCFIEQRQGLDTMLMEKGSNISGGQAQRIAIARALLVNPSIMIFDEATSNIDAESEELIMNVIHRLAKERTIILISHRLANVVSSEQILMLYEGKITEMGDHASLMEKKGEYYRIFDAQHSLENVSNHKEIPAKNIRLNRSNPNEYENLAEEFLPQAGGDRSQRRSGLSIMLKLIGLIKPLIHVMFIAIAMGVAGFLAAIFISITAVKVLGSHFLAANVSSAAIAGRKLLQSQSGQNRLLEFLNPQTIQRVLMLLIVFALLRGIFHYIEQYCNHYIAFKILEILRHKVFSALRKLAPAKLDHKDKGNLISIITTDIELLEVFYAHTISPIAIGFLVSVFMLVYIGMQDIIAAILLLLGYVSVGVIIPLINGSNTKNTGMIFREKFGDLSGMVLSKLRGLDEILQFRHAKKSLEDLQVESKKLADVQAKLSEQEGKQRMMTNSSILMTTFMTLVYAIYAYHADRLMLDSVLVLIVAAMGSFGPVVALSNLSNNLNQTLASGERVLRILEEVPQVLDVHQKTSLKEFEGASLLDVHFAYPGANEILSDVNLDIAKNQILGMHGASGCGKSTILKLLMRFYDANEGKLEISGVDVRDINTVDLRKLEALVAQETHLFHDSIANNIAIARLGANMEEIQEAAKKASIHEFIESLPNGYDTKVGELGDRLSGGEKQRIGVARAFLHGAPLLLMDEPTSNLDSLNEGIILKALLEEAKERSVVIVSHRKSTMNIVDELVKVG